MMIACIKPGVRWNHDNRLTEHFARHFFWRRQRNFADGGLKMETGLWQGGCQCGAVRYEFSVRPDNPCLCHCRMCQKQFGNFFGSFAGSHTDNFRITRGTLSLFRSSDDAERGFCRDCGTPLTYKAQSRPRISVSIGSLDRHSEMKPQFQYGMESCETWLSEVVNLPGTLTGEGDNGEGDTAERYAVIRDTNRQHPDHPTSTWPVRSDPSA